ncbi:MAG TPA: DivIVA domain-containing protein [Acidimicrobiia bacterium]
MLAASDDRRAGVDVTPSDIRRKRFDVMKKGGYDPEAVHAYLNEVSFVIADQHRSLMEARARLSRVEKELEEFRSSGDRLEEAVLTASRSRNEAVSKAREEAELIVGRARREALQLLDQSRNDAEEFLDSARDEYTRIQRRAEHLRGVVRQTEDVLRTMAQGDLAQAPVDAGGVRLRDMLADPDSVIDTAATVEADAIVELDEDRHTVRLGGGARMPRGIDMGQAVDLLLDQLRSVKVPA